MSTEFIGNDINITNSVLDNSYQFTPSLISMNEIQAFSLNKSNIHNRYTKDVSFIVINSSLSLGNAIVISECVFD